MTVILTTSPGFGKHGRVTQRLAELGWELIRCTDTSRPDGGMAGHVGRADYLVVGLVPVTAAALEGAVRLKGVLKQAADAFYEVLDRYTLADLVHNRQALARILLVA